MLGTGERLKRYLRLEGTVGLSPTSPLFNKESMDDIITKLLVEVSEGVIGAVSVLGQLASHQNDAGMFLGTLVFLKSNNLGGSNLWMLYKDRNGEDIKALNDELMYWMSDGRVPSGLKSQLLQGRLEPI